MILNDFADLIFTLVKILYHLKQKAFIVVLVTGHNTARTCELVNAGGGFKCIIKASERGWKHEGEGIVTSIRCGGNWR